MLRLPPRAWVRDGDRTAREGPVHPCLLILLLEELGGLGPGTQRPGATGLPRTRHRPKTAVASAGVPRRPPQSPGPRSGAAPPRLRGPRLPGAAASRARPARSPPRRRARRRSGGRPAGWAAPAARGDPGSGPRASARTGTWPRAPGDPFRAARVTPRAPPLPRLTARSAKPPLIHAWGGN